VHGFIGDHLRIGFDAASVSSGGSLQRPISFRREVADHNGGMFSSFGVYAVTPVTSAHLSIDKLPPYNAMYVTQLTLNLRLLSLQL
jgi:hypothetical protein